MFVLFTDFGVQGPYVGQMKSVLHSKAPGRPVVDLMHDVPVYDIRAAAYLLPAFTAYFPFDSIFLCVVDPGVGSERPAAVLRADGRWFIGPDNGLFAPLVRRAEKAKAWHLLYSVDEVSASFHGRDVFAPVAARLSAHKDPHGSEVAVETLDRPDWPDELDQIIYFDHYGNAMTGRRAASLSQAARLEVAGQVFEYARTFSEVSAGTPFWYENANGLVELAVNQGNAQQELQLQLGAAISLG